MTKLLIILLIGLTFESVGVVLLKKGMSQIGDIKKIRAFLLADIEQRRTPP